MFRLTLAAAAAGAMGWGIRGQFGHETGAMIAGVLVSLVVVSMLRPHSSAHWAMRAVALGTIGAGVGGAMTYGQTIGLTQDPALVGNWAALRWGLLGLSLKGGLWIGIFGVLLGMGLGTVRYRARELCLVALAAVALAMLGTWLLNAPYDPAQRDLPRLYFSASWHWRPDAIDLRPRREIWGGLLLALTALAAYTRWVRGDDLAWRLAGWGTLGGAVGFPLGQSLQAYHAWNPEAFARGIWVALDPHVNWWNAMETTFGAVMGASLAFGAWHNRSRIAVATTTPDTDGAHEPPALPVWLEWAGLSVHAVLLLIAEFTDVPVLSRYADVPLLMGVLPLALVAGGRSAPAVIALPMTLLPIAGKTVRRLVYQQHAVGPLVGWVGYAVVPMALMCATAWWLVRGTRAGPRDGPAVQVALLLAVWVYCALNFAFFGYPWPWAAWTNRTLHALVFAACALLVTWVCQPEPAPRPVTR